MEFICSRQFLTERITRGGQDRFCTVPESEISSTFKALCTQVTLRKRITAVQATGDRCKRPLQYSPTIRFFRGLLLTIAVQWLPDLQGGEPSVFSYDLHERSRNTRQEPQRPAHPRLRFARVTDLWCGTFSVVGDSIGEPLPPPTQFEF